VTKITKEGFLRFLPVGGWWEQVMLAQRVIVKTRKGDVPGIIGSKPPHILDSEERNKVVKKKDMFIDIGAADEEEAQEELGVRPGDAVVPDSRFQVMANGRLVMGKAWDDRIGVALFIDVMRLLKDEDHPNTLYGVGTVQEEVGLRGAQTSADASEAVTKIGAGPSVLVLDASMIPNRRLVELCEKTAEEEDIPFQPSAMARGGTDAGRIHLHSAGVPSLVISVPTRYIHSHTSVLSLEDYDNTVKLVAALVKRLDAKTVAWLTDF